ncbi:MAG: chemotaxis protein CheA [Ignavibacteria bacterium]|nr:chemotaxis protein CheA [Ignavibacteria bacterium]
MTQTDQDNKPKGRTGEVKNELEELVECYIVENRELLDQLGQDLLDLENRPTDKELHQKVFRAVHTIKGTSSFLGFDQMTELAHALEDVLNKLRKGDLKLTTDMVDVLLGTYDFLKILFERIQTQNSEPIDLSKVLKQLRTIAKVSTKTPNASHPVLSPDKDQTSSSSTPVTSKTTDSVIRVDVGRINELMNLVGELVLARNRLGMVTQKMNEEYDDFPLAEQAIETSSQIDFITTELQMAVLKTRMIPIEKLVNRLPRLIRDVSREMSKNIELQIYGEDTEIDKFIIDELNDPLIHILRNAADHGIELPEERQKVGKASKGTIIVRVEREGNQIVITIQDDGRGMDPEKLTQAALKKGLISEARAREMTKRDAFNLIFEPGFTTAEQVTHVSGRGVGLDVVRTNISKLKGIIDIESEIGVGSKFVLKLPLTLAVIQGLLVKAGEEIFSIPIGSVLEVVRVEANEIDTIDGREVYRLRNMILPLAQISQVLGVNVNGTEPQWRYIVVTGLADQRLGIVVDSLLGQKELVIRSLGRYLGNVPGISGSTILGDGKVMMIIDVGQFMELYARRS